MFHVVIDICFRIVDMSITTAQRRNSLSVLSTAGLPGAPLQDENDDCWESGKKRRGAVSEDSFLERVTAVAKERQLFAEYE